MSSVQFWGVRSDTREVYDKEFLPLLSTCTTWLLALYDVMVQKWNPSAILILLSWVYSFLVDGYKCGGISPIVDKVFL